MNILLLDKNIYYCKTLMNAISALNKEIRISFIVNSIEELSYIYEFDLILADYEFYGTGLENKFENCKILYLTEADNNEHALPKDNIDLIIENIENISKILSSKYIDTKLYSELVLLGYNASILGTKYILEALKMMYFSKEASLEKSIASNIYPMLAEKFGVSENAIKSNVNYATSKMLKSTKNKDLFKGSDYKTNSRIGVKTVLHYILQRVKCAS